MQNNQTDEETFYGETKDDLVSIHSTPQAKNNSTDELSLKWKEALSQIDYGFDYDTSSIFVFGDIADGTLYDLILKIRAILYMRSDATKNDPITIIINSDGGDVYEALGMIDYINSLDVKVNTICRGRAMSAAALLLCAGTGIRAASKNATIMFHELSSGLYGKSSDMKANMQHIETLDSCLINIMTVNSNKSATFWKDITGKDYYLSPEEALELNVIDTIIPSKHERIKT